MAGNTYIAMANITGVKSIAEMIAQIMDLSNDALSVVANLFIFVVWFGLVCAATRR